MKKALAILGGIFLLLIVVGVGFAVYGVHTVEKLNASSKAYVEANIPPILSTWSKKQFLKRSSPQLLKIVNDNPKNLDLLFHKLSKLGKLKSFSDVEGASNVSYTTQNGKTVVANYTADAKFQNAKAKITIRLIQSPKGKWQLLLFDVRSPLFLK